MEMLGGVLIFRAIAAPNVAASQAKAKVDPGITGFEAFFASVGRIGLYAFWGLGQVNAEWLHASIIPYCIYVHGSLSKLDR